MIGFFSTGFLNTPLVLFALLVSIIAFPQKGFGLEKSILGGEVLPKSLELSEIQGADLKNFL